MTSKTLISHRDRLTWPETEGYPSRSGVVISTYGDWLWVLFDDQSVPLTVDAIVASQDCIIERAQLG